MRHHWSPQERVYWAHLLGPNWKQFVGGFEGPESPPRPGYKNAVRPPWAPPEPPPMQVPPPLLPGLFDLAEQAGLVEDVVRCPDCGVFFTPWVSVTNAQFVLGQLTISGCSCEEPRHYEKQTARKLGLLS